MAEGFRTARLELGRHDWSAYRAPGSGGPSLPEVFLRMFDAHDQAAATGFSLEHKLEVQSMVFEVALPAVGVIMAAYADGGLPQWVEDELLTVLHNVITGEPHRSELERGNVDLVDRCIATARSGIWSMYARLTKSNADFLLDVLDFVDDDRDRLSAFQARFAGPAS